MDASVRKRPWRVGHAGETKIVAKRRTVVTFYVSYYKSVNSHRDGGGFGRETQNCRHCWTRLGFSRLKREERDERREERRGEDGGCKREERGERERKGERIEERAEDRRERSGERIEER